MYKAIFSNKAVKSFRKIPRDYQLKLKEAVLKLEDNPYSPGTIKLTGFPVAQYRRRVGDYRILFDIEDMKKIVIIADIKRRTSMTY